MGDYFKDYELLCPGCGQPNLHHESVEVYERDREDSETGIKAVMKRGLQVSRDMMDNPSRRRNGVRMVFNCEHCDAISDLTVIQHKGTTYLDQKILRKRQSIIVECNGETLQDVIASAIKAWEGAKEVTEP